MTDVIVIGGGPAGLSAALFTAKNGLDTVVLDTDDTAMHAAYLYNYLGVEEIHGSEFMDVARRQVEGLGADLHGDEEVTGVSADGDVFTVTTAVWTYDGRYVVFASGRSRELAEGLGCELSEDGTVAVNLDNETSVQNAYAAGWCARADKIQAAISVGGGAAAGLDILSKEAGHALHDFDKPTDD